jgi:N utilization substance protein B
MGSAQVISRRKGREFAMQLLYAVEVGSTPFLEAVKNLSTDPDLAADAKDYGVLLARAVLGNQKEIDALIAGVSANWDLDRLAVIDRIIIRCALAELMNFPDIPLKVAINEAVDIAKKFSTSESSRFVNGVLDAVAKQISNPSQRNLPDV